MYQSGGNEQPVDPLALNQEPNQVMVVRNPLKPHHCDRCSKSFTSVHQLAQHTRVHTGEKPYPCPYCERRFKQQSHVKQHSRLHTGERPYKCSEPTCGRSFIQLSNLQQHMNQHVKDPSERKTRELNHHCHICGKGFATESSLCLHHEKKHKDVLPNGVSSRSVKCKPFVCATCNKSYTTESALHIHAIKHVKPEMSQSTPATSAAAAAAAHERLSQLSNTTSIECRVCSETFISIEGLDEHVKIAHPPNVMRHPPVVYPPMSYGPPMSMPLPPPSPAITGVPWIDHQVLSYPYPPSNLSNRKMSSNNVK